jgi:class 3 adenylate cyclase
MSRALVAAEQVTLGPQIAAGRHFRAAAAVCWSIAALLPLIGLVSLLWRAELDPEWSNPRIHFMLFLTVGAIDFLLAYSASEAAKRRGDARVFLLSLAFLATGGFLGLHAFGTAGVLFDEPLAGFKVAIPVGCCVAALFGGASAFVDHKPAYAPLVMRRRAPLRRAVLVAMAVWFAWTVTKLPPLDYPSGEGGTRTLLTVIAAFGMIVYAVAAARYWLVYRGRMTLLPASIIACFVLLAEALVGVVITGERNWHASWWEWHALIVTGYSLIAFAAHREWSDERFRRLYLPTTRECSREVTVVFSDLAGFTRFSERCTPAEAANMLNAYYEVAAPLVSRRFGGQVEMFMGDGMMASFNSRGDQPDHAVRAAGAALCLQRELTRLADDHPGWPRLRVGVNSGEAIVRELGGHGLVSYSLIGDTVNAGARLEGQAPIGGVLIGAETYRRLPDGAVVEPMLGLKVKGKDAPIDAYVLRSLPAGRARDVTDHHVAAAESPCAAASDQPQRTVRTV